MINWWWLIPAFLFGACFMIFLQIIGILWRSFAYGFYYARHAKKWRYVPGVFVREFWYALSYELQGIEIRVGK